MNYSLVAVSGGSDSMALLDMLRKEKKNLVVCHVNYDVRGSASRDEDIVKKYCDKYNIKLEILKEIKYNKEQGNFENWARIVRYNFFKEIYYKYNCDFLYIGHNLDDLLETYFIQKKRNGKCDFYGIKEESFLYDMKVKRILLGFSKDSLKEYCLDNEIIFGVDETNFDTSYLRNKIRSECIRKMSEEDKKRVVNEINELNTIKDEEYKRIHCLLKKCINGNNSLDLKLFNNLDDGDKRSVIYYLVIEYVKEKVSISDKRLQDIVKKIESDKANVILGEFNGSILYKEYNCIVIKKKENDFMYVIEDLNCDVGDFVISNVGRKLERVVVSEELFPLKIENYRGDSKVINRLFIDKKVPLSERKSWPVVKDKLDRVLLVLNMKKFYNNMDSSECGFKEFYIRMKEKEKK